MDLLKRSVHKFISKPPDYLRETRPVKIAVLDTGLDLGHPFIQGAKRIKEARNFVDHHSSMADTHGHGTHVAALLLKVAPYAQIYVAKVATAENIPKDHRIAEVHNSYQVNQPL
jgi:subtilisin family serine protease